MALLCLLHRGGADLTILLQRLYSLPVLCARNTKASCGIQRKVRLPFLTHLKIRIQHIWGRLWDLVFLWMRLVGK